MNDKEKTRCARCGKRIKKGGVCYQVKTELISHFDGHLSTSQHESMSEILAHLDSDLDGLTEDQLEKQIYHKIEYLACPVCRDEIEKFLEIKEEEEA